MADRDTDGSGGEPGRSTRRARVIGVPTDYGTDRRGVDMGPSAIRYAGLQDALESIGLEVDDSGDLKVPSAARYVAEPTSTDEPTVRGLAGTREIEAIEDVTGDLADAVAGAVAEGAHPLVLGGDHSVAIGTLRGAARDADLGVVWFDAHGDFNTPATTPSGNVHGMALAAALGRGSFADTWADAGIDPENVAIVGVRDLDPGERDALRDSPVTVRTMSAIDDRGMGAVVEEALDVATEGTDALHVSLDLDVLDPDVAPGVGTPVRGGATYREAHAAMEAVASRGDALRSLELIEVNPVLDRANRTAELAVELAASAFGKRIL
jgi:arginase